MRALIIISTLLLFSCSPESSTSSGGMSTGTPAPNFSLTSVSGERFTLSELEGKVVYLFFYGADCPHCRSNGPVTETEIHQNFQDNPYFVALGLDTWNQGSNSNEAFQSVTGITYPLLLNAQSVLIDYYGSSSAYDRSVVVSPDGTIAYKGSGFVNTDYETVIDVINNELSNL